MKNFFKFGVMAIAAFVLTSCGGKSTTEEAKVKFETKVLKAENRVYTFEFPALLHGDKEIEIVPQVSGRIVSKKCSNGNMVNRGQVIMVIDPTPYRLEVQTAQANVSVAKAQAETARLEYESSKNLADKKIVSNYVVQTNYNNYKTAMAAVQQAQAQVAIARTNLGYCTITAPVTGIVTGLDVNEGSIANPGESLCIISSNNDITVKFSINEGVYLDYFSDGMKTTNAGLVSASGKSLRDVMPPVELKLKNGTKYPVQGYIESVDGELDATTGTATLIAKFPNPNGLLHSGLSATVILPYKANGVLCVPQTAAVKMQDQYMVYRVKKDGTVEGVIVSVIPSNDGSEYYILDGIKAGEEVVTNGVRKLTNGMKVK